MNGVRPDLESIIRAQGTAINMQASHDLYEPVLANQPKDGVEVLKDLAYGDDERHRFDIYRPEGNAKGLPVLVYLHGGGFVRGDKSDRHNGGYFFARSGFVTVIPNYRLGPTHRWPAGAEDVARLVQWLQAHIADHGGDPAKVVLMGESAGAAHVGTASLLRRFHPQGKWPVRGLVMVSGGGLNLPLEDLASRQLGIPTPNFRNDSYFGPDRSKWPSMSMVDLIDADPMPVFISYAELDPTQMQVQSGDLFARLVTQHGFDPELHVVRGHNHISQVYAVNTGDTSLTDAVLAFARRCTADAA